MSEPTEQEREFARRLFSTDDNDQGNAAPDNTDDTEREAVRALFGPNPRNQEN